jgi:hypothetical protein
VEETVERPKSPPAPTLDEIAARVESTRERLRNSPAGVAVDRAIECHGGLDRWLRHGSLMFRYDYAPIDSERPRRDLTQTVDVLTGRMYQDVHHPVSGVLVLDQGAAWSTLPLSADAIRLHALTPYYLVAVPFVLADGALKLKLSGDLPGSLGLPAGVAVSVAFAEGPFDRFVVFFAEEDGCVTGVRFKPKGVAGAAPDARAVTSESVVVYGQYSELSGIRLASTATFYGYEQGKRGQFSTLATVSEWSVGGDFNSERLKRRDETPNTGHRAR